MEYTVSDIVEAAATESPTGVMAAFDAVMKEKAVAKLDEFKVMLASSMFNEADEPEEEDLADEDEDDADDEWTAADWEDIDVDDIDLDDEDVDLDDEEFDPEYEDALDAEDA
jgi:hypothetical protein